MLDKIIADKREELVQKKRLIPEMQLVNTESFLQDCASLKNALLKNDATGIIAEFKRKSPSKGWINQEADLLDVIADYDIYGASGVSILTDEIYFGGTLDDMVNGRRLTGGPILRKDFIIDEYQVIETKASGADVMLLIAACLTRQQVKRLAFKAQQLGLEVLLEVHEESELDHICDAVDIVGINNRNLKTFEVNVETSLQLGIKVPGQFIKISESGISDVDTIRLLKENGFKGFLIGETFMKEKDPGEKFHEFVKQLKAQ